MTGCTEPESYWEIVLYADDSLVADLPRELFFDDDVLWHQQDFRRVGQVAAVDLVLDGRDLYTMVHQSDLVQRISRRREYKTRVESRFKGWNHMLLNAVLDFALEHDVTRVHVPTADLAVEHTARDRPVGRELFDRVYDRDVHRRFSARRDGGWWVVEVDESRGRVVLPETRRELLADEKTIALCHDIERGLGFLDVDEQFASVAGACAPASLDEMLAVERATGVSATYCVVGAFMDEVRPKLDADGHCVAFHSYDHRIDRLDQLTGCRRVDYRLKGYRPPRSVLTPELTDENLCFHNFEWLASSATSLGIDRPELRRRLVRIPIAFDDHPLHTGHASYAEWERRALRAIERRPFTAFSLHDCYGPLWLSRYPCFLEKVRGLGRLRTLDEVSADVLLAAAT
ncbi:MAG: hypothetical protein ACJ756_05450 [Solirubrobacterales bacterium]